MTMLSQLLRASRATFAIAVATSSLAGLGSTLLVVAINQALAADATRLSALSVCFGVLALLVPALRWLSASQFVALRQATLSRLRIALSGHIAHAPFAELEGDGASRFLAILIEDVNTVSEFFVALPRFVMQGAIVFAAFCYLAWLSWQALLFALTMVLLGSLIHFAAVRRASHHLELGRAAEDTLYGHFRVLVASGKELALSGARRDHFLNRRLGPSLEDVKQHNTRGFLAYVGAGSFGAFMFFAVIGAVIFGLGSIIDFGRAIRSGYVLMFLYIMFPLEDLLEAVPDLLRVRISLKRIESVCGQTLLTAAHGADAHLAASVSKVELRAVSHRYRRDSEDGVFQLGPVSLSLNAGEVVYLVGGNGSGKTTLAKLFVGLYEPETGEVLVDGERIGPEAREGYRQLFSAVFSDFHLFENTLGLDTQDDDRQAKSLLSALALTDKVTIEAGRFSTTQLSSGQRKRLALLVACLEQRPFCVFDEWAADQDPAFKEVFYTRILPALKAQGKGVLVITHDDRYFHLADRCLKLEHGQLTETTGAHASRDERLEGCWG